MDHSGGHQHGGGDVSMSGLSKAFDIELGKAYWYGVAGTIGLALVVRGVNYYEARTRLRARASTSKKYPTQPSNKFLEAWATTTAIFREMSYPQLYVPFNLLHWMTPPPLGRVLVLLTYWAIIIAFLTVDAIIKDYSYYERIGFRAAWVTIAPLPLIYLLASKTSIIGFITGVSYERLNWMHRWVSRTMFVTASIHGWHFYDQYVQADIAEEFFEMLPMGYWGIIAWSLLGWSVVSTFAPFRHMWYELFVIQHILTAIIFLWAVYMHIPPSTQYHLWFAIAALCFDRAGRWVLLLWHNFKVRVNPSRCKGGQRIGHHTQLRAVGEDITIVTIKDVHFKWRAGQHLYLWMPQIGPIEAHPYTISCAHRLQETCICNSIQLVVRKHGGFSKRLHAYASKMQAEGKKSVVTTFVTGPYGAPARWDIYETLVLVSASTGASFTLPILESVLQTKDTNCTKRVDFLLAAKKGDEIDYYVQRLHEFIQRAKDVGIELNVHVAVTRGPPMPELNGTAKSSAAEHSEKAASSSALDITPAVAEKSSDAGSMDIEKVAESSSSPRQRPVSTTSSDSHVHQMTTRPDIATFIREAVEATGGETSVVVCGGKSLVSRTRNCVAKLSDERAVHKGTGAQGIHLHVEEYCF